MARYLGVLLAALAADLAVWHLLSYRVETTMLIGGVAGLAVALGVVQLSGLQRRARDLLTISLVLSTLLSLVLILLLPLLQPLAARALAALAALGFALFGFALYLRKPKG